MISLMLLHIVQNVQMFTNASKIASQKCTERSSESFVGSLLFGRLMDALITPIDKSGDLRDLKVTLE